ncbi:hypothetical protein [Acinetobacter baumannii]|uniref:hypothetical protein n=1 Tax=Acinetobacter baumannii TaxID=470 RepID=UPI0039088F7E
MQNKIFFTHAFFLLYGLAMHAYAIDDISLPDRIRQEQRLKELANSNMRCDSLKSLMIINKLSKFL